MRLRRLTALRAIAVLLLSASLAGISPAGAAEKKNWTATVAVKPDGTHVLGNPDAKVHLDEFVSYTCPHCASFEQEAEAPMRLAYVMPGKVSVRVVHLIRDPVDLTVAMLTNCGNPAGFFVRHQIFLASQDTWLARMESMTDAQKLRWRSGEMPARMRAIASDFKFYDIMARRGIDRSAADQCLADKDMAQRIVAQTGEADKLKVPGTPSFAMNGELLDSVHDWDSLNTAIKSHL